MDLASSFALSWVAAIMRSAVVGFAVHRTAAVTPARMRRGGGAEVTCEGGCVCLPSVLEGHWEQRNSQLSMHRVSVSQSPQCTLKIRVLNSTSSGEHKVKIQVQRHTVAPNPTLKTSPATPPPPQWERERKWAPLGSRPRGTDCNAACCLIT